MNYLKYFLIFSLLGFIMESVVYKVSGSNSHSGVLLGPYTLVYGFGGLLVVLINNYFSKIEMNSFFKIILLFIFFTIICTLIEYLIGNLIHYIFNIDKQVFIKYYDIVSIKYGMCIKLLSNNNQFKYKAVIKLKNNKRYKFESFFLDEKYCKRFVEIIKHRNPSVIIKKWCSL